MTVSNTNKKNTYTGDGATTTFAFTFKVIKSADVLVKIKDVSGLFTTKTEGTHYNVTGTLPGTGNVVFTSGNIPISTDTVVLTRDMDFLQETDLVEKDAFPADTVEQQLDQLTMQDLQLKEVSDRVVQLDETVDTDTVSATLPTPSANKFIAWNSDATALEGVTYTAVGLGSLLDDPSPQCAADLDMNGFNLVFDDNKGIKDDQGNELLWFQNLGTNTAVNHYEIINAATGSSPLLKAVGDDANVDMRIASQGTSGDVRIESASGITEVIGTSASSAEVRLFEDTDNGSNYIGHKAAASLASNTTYTWPVSGSSGQILQDTDGSGTLGWAAKGKVVQVVNVMDGNLASTASNIGQDNSIPQSSEGAEFMSLSITPTSATNKLKIDVVVHGGDSNSSHTRVNAALFQDSTAGALAAVSIDDNQNTTYSAGVATLAFSHYMTSGTTSSTTFKVRCSAASTFYFNGNQGGSRLFGGVSASSITITEIEV